MFGFWSTVIALIVGAIAGALIANIYVGKARRELAALKQIARNKLEG